MRCFILALSLLSVCAAVTTASAQQAIGVEAKRLVVVDKRLTSSKAKIVLTAKDAAVSKGAATDPDNISALVTIAYDGADGTFLIPPGRHDGDSGWLTNDATLAKYTNRNAPNSPTHARSVVVRPAEQLILKARGVGDLALDIVTAGAPSGSVFTLFCVSNGVDQICHCSEFSACKFKTGSSGSTAKLVCNNGVANPSCALSATITATTLATTTSGD